MDKLLNEVLDDSIAIIGMAGRFPGANTIQQFWENICLGKESITFFSDAELIAAGVSEQELTDSTYIKAKGLIDDIDKFDAKLFGVLPKEAIYLDPQQRVLLETVWTALEDAGYQNEAQAGRVGVFVGSGFNTYYPKIICKNSEYARETGDINAALGNGNDYLSTRISYKFNFTGPSLTIQTACSTSLVAVSLACNHLLEYQCDMAIAGGSSAFFPIVSGYHFRKEFILSADGHCRPWDEKSTGVVFSMGVGVVILKRLTDAIKNGDLIYAVIRGWAVNNDGSNKVGFTAPTEDGQTQVIVEAQTIAQVDPSTIQFIEAHATGTPIGDPIEIAALKAAFQGKTDKNHFCALGAVKANIGHLDAAAGIAGLIKTALVLKNKKIPPVINFKQLNSLITLENSPFYIPTELEDWKEEGTTRRAAVSSFGVGGTNAHVVLESAPLTIEDAQYTEKSAYLLTLSAATDQGLKQRLLDLAYWVSSHGQNAKLSEVSFTLNVTRKSLSKRCAIIADSMKTLQTQLEKIIRNDWQHLSSYEYIGIENINQISGHEEVMAHLFEDLEASQVIDPNRYREKLFLLGKCYVQGQTIDWQRLYQFDSHRKINLPTYPFERTRYWVPEVVRQKEKTAEVFFYHPRWQVESVTQTEITAYHEMTGLLFYSASLSQVFLGDLESAFQSLQTLEWPADFSFLSQQFAKDKLPDCIIFQADFKEGVSHKALSKTFYSILSCAQALLKMKPTQTINLIYCYVSTEKAFIEPFMRALGGLLKSISLEHPVLRGRLLCSDQHWEVAPKQWVDRIFEMIAHEEIEVRFERNERFVKRLISIPLERKKSTIFRKQGVYLITGGASGLGWLVASHLATHYQARLVLMGRRHLNELQKEQIKNLSNQGAEIIYLQGDVTLKKEVEEVVTTAKQHFGFLHGIVHCAGMIQDSLVTQKKKSITKKVLAPKIKGTLNLDAVTRHDSLDCFILFSSVVAHFGNIGQSDYAYANAFLNAFAEQRSKKRRGKTVAINWPPWEQGGMQISSSLRNWLQKNVGFSPLTTSQGINAFEMACAENISPIIVLAGDKQKIDAFLAPSFKKNEKKSNEKLRDTLIQLLCEVTQLTATDVDDQTSLFDMGLDSIVLAQYISHLEKELNINLDAVIQDILISPTIANIVHFINSEEEQQQALPDNPYREQIVILNKEKGVK